MSAARELPSPAKVNLRLEVLGKRADGYHELDTVLATLGLVDRLEVRLARRPGVTLAVDGPAAAGVPADGSNLAVRAVEAALAELGAADGVGLRLEKHVPAGAGLGGGSSNAAMALLGLLELLHEDPDEPRWAALLAGLGSDCPFFLRARSTGLARARGRGEEIEGLPALRGAPAVLVLQPDLVVPTAGVYGALAETPRGPRPVAWPADVPTSLEALRALLHNDLEAPARRLHPELEAWREVFAREGVGHFLLSGSGSSFFGLLPDLGAASELGARLEVAGKARDLGLRGRWVGDFAAPVPPRN